MGGDDDGRGEVRGEMSSGGGEAGWPVETTATGEKVLVEVHTKDVKGLTINDFILATKIEADEEVAAMIVKKAKVVRNWI